MPSFMQTPLFMYSTYVCNINTALKDTGIRSVQYKIIVLVHVELILFYTSVNSDSKFGTDVSVYL